MVHLSALQPPSLLETAAALPHVHGSPGLGVLRRLRPVPDPIGRRWTQPRYPRWQRGGRARTETVPVFTAIRSTKEEPNSVPAASPRLPRSTSPWPPGRTSTCPPGSSPPRPNGIGTHRTRPRSARFEPVTLEGRRNAGSSRTPLRHARRTHTIWQCWRVPALSGLLPPSPAPPGSGCPQLHRPCCDRTGGEGLPPPLESSAPHGARGPGFVRAAPTLHGTYRIRLPPATPSCCDSNGDEGLPPPFELSAPHGARGSRLSRARPHWLGS